MARSNIRTWLALDRWAEIIGLNPLAFNQLSHSALFPGNTCGEIFFQYDWQNADRLGRDTISMAIQAAEREMAAEAGFNLLPDWTVDERVAYPQPGVPGQIGYGGRQANGLWKSAEVKRGHVLSGGIRTKDLIQAGASITRQDDDVDGYSETCVVNVTTSVTDINEIHAYYPGKSGQDGWEIRPIRVSISGGVANIQFKAWQIAAANQMDALNAAPLDATKAASYETTVDVYRVWNDPQTQVSFLWEDCGDGDCCGSCVACQFGAQSGCFHNRDPRLGLIAPTPGTWDSSSSSFTSAEWSVCREPDQMRVYYYSGWQNMTLDAPRVQMDPFWEYAVAYYACSKFERPVCGCSNVQQFIEKWTRDISYSSTGEGSFVATPEVLGNKLGTSMGAIYAWKRIHQNGVRVIK